MRVDYAALNPTDLDFARGSFDWLFSLARVASPVKTGLEFSGVVVERSPRFGVGDRVFGYAHLITGPKTHQQYISVPDDQIARIPASLGFAEAAALPLGAQTSLAALRRVAHVHSGQSVLLYGASGGLGVYAIQIAKTMGLLRPT